MNSSCHATLPSPGETLEALGAMMLLSEDVGDDNRRINIRRSVLLGCLVYPLNPDLSEMDVPIEGLSRDVSVAGIGFVTTGQIPSKLIRLDFPAEASVPSIFLKLRHQTPTGAFYVCGGEVAVNWDFD